MKKAKVIIGTDFKENSNLAIETGINWAKKMNYDVTVIHIHDSVIDTDQIGVLYPEFESKAKDLAESMNRDLEKKIEKQIEPWRKDSIKIDTIITFGNCVERFLEISNLLDGKLLVIPIDNSEGDSFFLGTVAERLIRVSQIPVLVVKNRSVINPQSIAFPFAFQGFSQDAAQWAQNISELFSSKITPIHINKDHPIDKIGTIDELQSLMPECPNAKEVIHQIKSLKKSGKVKKVVLKSSKGKNSKEILDQTLKEINSDLVIMGSSKTKGLMRLYLGSFSEYVLKHSTSSLLITKSI